MASDAENVLQALAQALFMISAIQGLGYILARNGVLTDSTQAGIGFYVGVVALPCCFFHALATLPLASTNWGLLACVCAAKLFCFILAAALGRLLTKTTDREGMTFSLSGVMALSATMSDDIGLGLPVMTALYPVGSDGSSLVKMLYVLSACARPSL